MMRKYVSAFFCLVLTLVATGCGGGGSSTTTATTPPVTTSPPPVMSNTATIDFGASNQTIRGFGGATAWMPVMPSPEVNALFGTGANQIGLSILRVRIDPSSTTGGTNWDTEVSNAKEAIAAGSNVIVIATPWTPPGAWKLNPPDPTHPLIMGSLNPANYAQYANYLESFVNYMGNAGVSLYGISMQNEPDANVTYESCAWTPAQMDAWVANNASVLSTKLIMPEAEGFNTSYSDAALSDPNAVGKIGIIAGHIYGASPSYYTNAVNAGKEVWMTEHYLNPVGSAPGIADALQAAKEIHDSLTVANYNAYLWWWVADWNPGNGVTNTGLVDTNNAPTYYGWAVAQFSRFVRPGFVRSNATFDASKNVFISAFKDAGNGHFVIVSINMNPVSVNQTFTIQNQNVTSMTPYLTTTTATVAQQSAVSVSANQFTYILPGQSIVTFVQ